jgi:hypothetical protein
MEVLFYQPRSGKYGPFLHDGLLPYWRELVEFKEEFVF